MSFFESSVIHPVILSVDKADRLLKGRLMVQALSFRARQALYRSAKKSGVVLPELSKDQNRTPLPINGVYWSISHKPAYVAGVVANRQIGIDLEKIRPCSNALIRKVAGEKEWALVGNGSDQDDIFFRFWTAKEAVLKAEGIGLQGLSRCKIISLPATNQVRIDYNDKIWLIEQFRFNGHIAAVIKNNFQVNWEVKKKEKGNF